MREIVLDLDALHAHVLRAILWGARKVHCFHAHAVLPLRRMSGNGTNWLDLVGDAFLLFVLFALWLWQFESSDNGSLYHFILEAIGFVCLIGVGVLLAVILVSAISSGRGS